jgi:hypothetical protein
VEKIGQTQDKNCVCVSGKECAGVVHLGRISGGERGESKGDHWTVYLVFLVFSLKICVFISDIRTEVFSKNVSYTNPVFVLVLLPNYVSPHGDQSVNIF